MSVIDIKRLTDSYKNSIRDDVKYNKIKSILLNHVRKMIDTYLEYRRLETKVNSAKSITRKYSDLNLDIVAITKNFVMNDKESEKNLKEIRKIIVKELFIKDKIVDQAIDKVIKAYALHLSSWIIQCDKILEAGIKDDDMMLALEENKVLQETTLENIIVAYTINIEKLSKYIDERIADIKKIVQEYEKLLKETQKSKRRKGDGGGSLVGSESTSSFEKDESAGVRKFGDADKTSDADKNSDASKPSGISAATSKESESSSTVKHNKKKVTGEPQATKRPTGQKVGTKVPIEKPPKLKVQEGEKKLGVAPSAGTKKKSVRAIAKSNIMSKIGEVPAVGTATALQASETEAETTTESVSGLQKVIEAVGKTIAGEKVGDIDLGEKQKKNKSNDLDSLINDYNKLEKQQNKLLQSIMKIRDKVAKAMAKYDKQIKNVKSKKEGEASTVDANKLIAKLLGISDTEVTHKEDMIRKDKGIVGGVPVSDSESDVKAIADLLKQQEKRSAGQASSDTQTENNEIVINQNNTNEVNNINLSTQENIAQKQSATKEDVKSKRPDKSTASRKDKKDANKDRTGMNQEEQASGRIEAFESMTSGTTTQSSTVSVTSIASKEVKPIPKEGESVASRGKGAMSGGATSNAVTGAGAGTAKEADQGKSTSVSEARSKRFLGTAREKLVEGLANAKTKFMYALQGVKGFSTKMFGGILSGLGWILNILSPFTFLFSKAFSVGAAFKALDTQTKLADLDKSLNEATNKVIVDNFQNNATSAHRVIDTLRGEKAREQIGEYALLSDRKNITSSGTAQAQKFSMTGGAQASSPPALGPQTQIGPEVAIGFNTREEDIKALKQQQDELNRQLIDMQKRLSEYQRQTMETDRRLSDSMAESHQTQMQLEVINHQASMKTAANSTEKRELYSY